MNTPSFVPRCPNHNEPLEGCGFPLPRKGTGICPVSKYPFDFEVDVSETEMVKDKFGNMQKKMGWKISGTD